MEKKKITMPYEPAPSGLVMLYNYKEPYMKYEFGHGYQGVLLFDSKTDKVQCHECGLWFDYLPSHIRTHNLSANEYKLRVGLRRSTALISETHREKLLKNRAQKMLNLRLHNYQHSEETKKKISETLKKNHRETQNENGTCPQQILDRIAKMGAELGRTPTKEEFAGYTTAKRLYGTWSNAVKLAGLIPRESGQNAVHKKRHQYSREDLLAILRGFVHTNKRLPVPSDYRRRLIPSNDTFRRYFGSFEKAIELIK